MLLILLIGAVLFAQAEPQRAALLDETVTVPRAQFRAIRIPVQQRPAIIECGFEVLNGPPVRLLVLTAADVDRMRAGRSYRTLAASASSRRGGLNYRVIRPGDYVVLIDNDGEPASNSRVHVSAGLQYRDDFSFTPVTLAPARRRAVVAASLALFAFVAGLAGWRLRRSTRQGPPRGAGSYV